MAYKKSDEYHDPEETRPKTIPGLTFRRTYSAYSVQENKYGSPEEVMGPEATQLNVESHINIVNCHGNIIINNYYQSAVEGGSESDTVRQTCHDKEETELLEDKPIECGGDLETDNCSSIPDKCDQDDETATRCVAPRIVFVKGEAFYHAILTLQQSNPICLVGGLGDGKTTTLNELAKHMVGYKIIKISHQSDLEFELKNIPVGTKLLACCDDVFGKTYILQGRLKSWMQNPLPPVIASLQSGQLKVALTCSKCIWSRVKSDFANHKFFQTPVFLSWSSRDEREMLLQSYHCVTETKMSANLWNVFLQIENPLAFPHSCQQLLTGSVPLLESQTESDLKQAIQNPLSNAARQIEYVEKETPNKYFSMVVLMFQGGILMQSELSGIVETLETNGFSKAISREPITTKFIEENLCACGPDLVKVSTIGDIEYSFVDSFLFEAVVRSFGKTHKRSFLKNAKTEFILDRCCVEVCSASKEEASYHIPIHKEDYDMLARIMTNEIIKGNAVQVFANPSLNVIEFQEAWLNHLITLPSQIQTAFANSNFVKLLSADLQPKLLLNYVLVKLPTTSQGHTLCQEIYSAADKEELILLNRFRKKGVNLNTPGGNGKTPAEMATVMGKAATLSTLLQFGADPYRCSPINQRTLLHLATKKGHVDVVDVLLEHSALVNKYDTNEIYPLHLAAQKGNLPIIRRLVDRGAIIDVQNRWDKTPLHCAVESGHVPSVNYILQHDADVHSEDRNQQTAIHFAAKRKDPKMMSLLLDRGSDAFFKDFWGKSAQDYAIENGSWNSIGLVCTPDSVDVSSWI